MKRNFIQPVPLPLFCARGGAGVFQVEDEDAVVVQTAAVESDSFEDLDTILPAKAVCADAPAAVFPLHACGVSVLFARQPRRAHPDHVPLRIVKQHV